jgi:thiol-disulfide isomerase/thioredoxin
MTLYEFYGEECPHCKAMEDRVEKLQEEHDVEVEQKEVWHDEENAELHQKFDDGKCGGVPFFYNTETEDFVCGETDMDRLREWAGVA